MIRFISIISLCIALISCATVSSLPGGERDVTPPRVVSSTPDSGQTSFYSTEIRITFDEYFTINNLNQELIVSPPFDKAITHKIKGKNLLLKLPAYPLENTTYQMHFGGSIKDVNEGNAMKNYSLIFSSGESIDSGEISGKVIKAIDQEPAIGSKVVLYLEDKDSSIFKEKPYYLSITDSSGNFKFHHISQRNFQIVALTDNNQTNTLQVGEEVAFFDEMVETGATGVAMSLFEHKDTRQLKILRSKEVEPGRIILTFNREVDTTAFGADTKPEIAANKTGKLKWSKGEKSEEINIFLPPADSTANDSVTINVEVENITIIHSSKRLIGTAKSAKLTLNNNAIKVYDKIALQSNYPILKTKTSSIQLYNITDSLFSKVDQLTAKDFDLNLSASLISGREYRLTIESGGITFHNRLENISDTFFFRTYLQNQLGEAEINLYLDSLKAISKEPILFKFSQKGNIGTTGKVIYQLKISSDTILKFKDLIPGEYVLSAFQDTDGNGRWTNGDFAKKRQPEQKFLQKEPVIIRANWENKNISFNID